MARRSRTVALFAAAAFVAAGCEVEVTTGEEAEEQMEEMQKRM